MLKLGRIKIYKDQRSPNARFILNKTELQDVFFPLLKYHSIFFLTENRRSQFNLAMFIFENNIKKFDQIPNYVETPSFSILPANSLGYLNLPFFKNWVVGFTTPNKYPDLIAFAVKNPLTIKRIKHTPNFLKTSIKARSDFKDLLRYLRGIRKYSTKNRSNNTILDFKTFKRDIVV